jgi:threonine aldolase
MTKPNPHFGSDNYAGVCPEVWEAMVQFNSGHYPAYGEDELTARACDKIREVFDADCEVFFVFNGTAANSLAIATICQPYHSVICAPTAHIETDECGAPEFFSGGTKILETADSDGKVSPAEIVRLRTRREDIHYPKPHAVSVTESTELGTVYTPSELRAICDVAHGTLNDASGKAITGSELLVHMDGARFANAVASLDVAPGDLTWRVGVDVLCFGGTKMGMPIGEAVLFFNKAVGREFAYRCKQAGQLASKMRFLAVPWLAMLEEGRWLDHARRANARAAQLEALLTDVPGVSMLCKREANAVFLRLPPGVMKPLGKLWKFYSFIGVGGCRFMCAWDTTAEEVESLAADVRRLAERALK